MSQASVPRVTRWGAKLNTLDHMREAVFFDGPGLRAQHTRFWLLLTLSSAIASAGVVLDSTATVIGAMIVAPLMRPIQGTMLATVLGDRRNLRTSIAVMILGAAGAVLVGFLVGMFVVQAVTAETNPQVAARVAPGLVDLFAALATGAVGSIALLRSDISDTLPGVAIAISLVPPLCVAGLALESGEPGQALGATLLFATNVAAILASGAIIMALYGFSRLRVDLAEDKDGERSRRNRAYLTTAFVIIVVAIPLTYSTVKAVEQRSRVNALSSYVQQGIAGTRWELVAVEAREANSYKIIVKGEPPLPDMVAVYERMAADGLDISKIEIELVPTYTFDVSDATVASPPATAP